MILLVLRFAGFDLRVSSSGDSVAVSICGVSICGVSICGVSICGLFDLRVSSSGDSVAVSICFPDAKATG